MVFSFESWVNQKGKISEQKGGNLSERYSQRSFGEKYFMNCWLRGQGCDKNSAHFYSRNLSSLHQTKIATNIDSLRFVLSLAQKVYSLYQLITEWLKLIGPQNIPHHWAACLI